MDLNLRGRRALITGSSKGIGLAIARSLVDAHGGRIWVEPGAAGGSRFVVDLPVGAAA